MTQIGELAEIVASQNVSEEPEVLAEYSKDQSFAHPVNPQYVVKPQNTEQVQRIVQWANEAGVPIIPVSSGPPHFRGDTVPSLSGMVVDLSGMKRIINISRPERVAMVEPGVTFGELQEALEKEGLRVSMPLSPRQSKSVMGSYLEREPITIPKYHIDASEPLLCLEVIYGSGDLFRTGDAAGPGTIEEQWKVGRFQKFHIGPGQVGFAKLIQGSQGTMGVATWASIRCEILPQIQKLLFMTAQSPERLIELTYWLLRLRLGDECLLLNNQDLACLLAGDSDVGNLKQTLPPWVLILCLAGYEISPEERISYQEKDVTDLARQHGLIPTSAIPGASAKEILDILKKPSREPYWKLRYKGGCHDIFFLTTMDRVPQFIKAMYEIANNHQYPSTDIGIYVQPIQQGRGCHCEFSLPCDPSNPREVEQVRELFMSASDALIKMGGFFSRPYGPWADMVYNRNAAAKEAIRKVKSIFDPNNIMNPGKLCF